MKDDVTSGRAFDAMSHALQAGFGSAVVGVADEIVTQQSAIHNWKREMTSAMWNDALLSNDRLAKYTVPVALVFGGGALLYAGYCLGKRQSKNAASAEATEHRKGGEETMPSSKVLEIKCVAGSNALKRVNSEMSMMSTDESERGSPVGDNYRCALIVRKDCGLGRSKIIIQSCRAFLAQFKKLYKQRDPELKEWERDGMTVVVLRAENEETLTSLKAKAAEMRIASHIFCAKQPDGSSMRTVMALGPSKTCVVKELTQHLLRL